jgi:hypothetical protein
MRILHFPLKDAILSLGLAEAVNWLCPSSEADAFALENSQLPERLNFIL